MPYASSAELACQNPPFDAYAIHQEAQAGPYARVERLRALTQLTLNYPLDDGLIAASYGATEWLREKPLWASVNFFNGSASLVSAALKAGSLEALRQLDRLGANLWLAAQEQLEFNRFCCGVENLAPIAHPGLWAIDQAKFRPDDTEAWEIIARLTVAQAPHRVDPNLTAKSASGYGRALKRALKNLQEPQVKIALALSALIEAETLKQSGPPPACIRARPSL